MLSYKKMSFLVLFICCLFISNTAQATGNHQYKLGINDELSKVTVYLDKGLSYVSVRDFANSMNLTMGGSAERIVLSHGKTSLTLLKSKNIALTSGGREYSTQFIERQDKMLILLRFISERFSYTLSYQPENFMFRVTDKSAKLSNKQFIELYKDKLKQAESTKVVKDSDIKGNKKVIYLTFDDGPTASTSELLNILSKYDAKATFFMLGPNITNYPQVLKRMVKEGQGLGLHSMTHVKNKFYKSPTNALQEMNQTNASLFKVTGLKTSLIRTPYGSKPYFEKRYRDVVLAQGYHLWDWNVDSEDWRYKDDSQKIYNSVIKQVNQVHLKKVTPIILMHDQKATLKVLPQLLQKLKKDGYEFKAITKGMTPVNFWGDKR
ncbi:peptidoglycan/xylan/chitin deacetylase (PgdA/CDA1 family) [Paenibacillus sp. DS2015]|uniref:polysaccharide deacetylase n=1 Tax=Paenibacillus sp. DS2015 TaxID=3373917 RepID=UPI003D250D65